jgi:hypothetical protein
MIVPIYAKVSFNNRIKNENNNNGITLLVFKSNLRLSDGFVNFFGAKITGT